MRALILLLPVLTACPLPQPGCTLENCRVMVDACSVELRSYSLFCVTNTARPATPVDSAPYCVKACNASPGNGALVECIAGKAEDCRAARDAGMFLELGAVCPSTSKPPQKACSDKCEATLEACDAVCSGGRPCDQCRRGGGTCGAVCPDAGFEACLDCSSKCTLEAAACSERCPRE